MHSGSIWVSLKCAIFHRLSWRLIASSGRSCPFQTIWDSCTPSNIASWTIDSVSRQDISLPNPFLCEAPVLHCSKSGPRIFNRAPAAHTCACIANVWSCAQHMGYLQEMMHWTAAEHDPQYLKDLHVELHWTSVVLGKQTCEQNDKKAQCLACCIQHSWNTVRKASPAGQKMIADQSVGRLYPFPW